MIFSIIIPTRNRALDLARTLPTLLAQTIIPEEIFIVDQSPDASTKKIVEEFISKVENSGAATPKFIYIYDPNLSGAGVARNLAIERASGEILVFLDDDVLLEQDFLEQILLAYRQNPGVGGVSGVITNYPRPPLTQRLLLRVFWIGPFHDERQSIYWNCDQLRQAMPFPVRKFGAGVMSLKREALNGKRFDPHYRGAGSEDVDLSWRISERWPLVMTPRARLFHIRTELGRARDHWFTYQIKCNHYLYYRLWDKSVANRLCFVWLNIGYLSMATLASVKRFSLGPWRAMWEGMCSGLQQAKLSGRPG